MKLTITREQLQEGLVAVAASVPAKTTLPVLANILLEASKDGLRLSGTDLDIAVSTTVPAAVDQEGSITLPARKLVEIVRELPSAPIRLVASGEQRVTIECGRSKFRLLGLPREEFPAFPAVKFDGGWKVSAGDLQKLISHVAFAASTEESRPILNGVLWELRPERMRMVATNGHRLARMDVPAVTQVGTAQPAAGQQADLIVPPKALEQIRRLFGPEDEVEIARSDNHLGFRSARTQIFTRLIEGPYPNYEQVIPRENDKAATADRAALSAALRRMSIVASDQTHRIRMAFASGACKLSVQTPDLGEAQEEVTVTYDGDPLEIGFNASYLLEILKFIPTDEVRLTFKAPERAATCEPVGWNDSASFLTLVMPLRLVD
ncbi:MAG TPA: DNA polymerase III subunit beta [Gemmatimonadales bacterium]|nr:DNA polymerase III subunit beta [Gemmatimonadales bacterium]